MMLNRAFVIKNSPPPVAGCRNSITAKGELTIGWEPNLTDAWVTVLAVLVIREGEQPAARAPPEATAGVSEVAAHVREQRSEWLGEPLPTSYKLSRYTEITLQVTTGGRLPAAGESPAFWGEPKSGQLDFVFGGSWYASAEAEVASCIRKMQRVSRGLCDQPDANYPPTQPDPLEMVTNLGPGAARYFNTPVRKALVYWSDTYWLRYLLASWHEEAGELFFERPVTWVNKRVRLEAQQQLLQQQQ